MKLDEERISSRAVFSGKLLKIREDTVRLPNGKESIREIIEHPGAVAIVAIEKDHVYLVKQYRAAAGSVTLEVPAGTLDTGEDPEVTASRELEEEIGKHPGRLTPLYAAFTSPGYSTEKMYFFLAESLQDVPRRPEDDESIEVVRVARRDISKFIREGKISDIKSILGLEWLLHRT